MSDPFNRVDRALAVIDEVFLIWESAFDGTPEAQIDALNYVADLQDMLPVCEPSLIAQIAAIHEHQREDWPQLFYDRIYNPIRGMR